MLNDSVWQPRTGNVNPQPSAISHNVRKCVVAIAVGSDLASLYVVRRERLSAFIGLHNS